jgi:hypothetical protein
LALAIKSGVDFPYLLYRMATDGDISPVLNYKIGTRHKWFLADLVCPLPQAGIPQRFRNLFESVDGYDDLSLQDPGAFLGEIYMLMRKYCWNKSIEFHSASSLFDQTATRE